jgi:glycosyltransferase involved in cell wall biosynthesis
MSQVDVIVPCYNYGHYLRECVESVLTQEGVDIRVLVIDDCSQDDTSEIAMALVEQDRRVEYRRHEGNRGHIATYNEGLEWGVGAYQWILSADDIMTHGAAARASVVLDEHPDVVMVYGTTIKIPHGTQLKVLPSVQPSSEVKIVSGREYWEEICQTGYADVPTVTVVVRRAIQNLLGPYRADLPCTADMEMWMRFTTCGSIAALKAPQAYYRVHESNMSHQYPGKKGHQHRKKAFDVFCAEYGVREQDRAVIRKSLAWDAFWCANGEFERGNVTDSRELSDQARQLEPAITKHPDWWKWQWKQRLGPKVWSAVRPFVRRLRSRPCRV